VHPQRRNNDRLLDDFELNLVSAICLKLYNCCLFYLSFQVEEFLKSEGFKFDVVIPLENFHKRDIPMTLEVEANVVYRDLVCKRKFEDENCTFTVEEKRKISESLHRLETLPPVRD